VLLGLSYWLKMSACLTVLETRTKPEELSTRMSLFSIIKMRY